MSLLAGTPITAGKYKVKPWKLKEINEFGENNYNLFISHLLVTKEKLKSSDSINKEFLAELDDYQAFCGLLLSDESTNEIVLKGLSATLGLNFFMDKYQGLYYLNEDSEIEIFDDSLFGEIRKTVSMQNYLTDEQSDNSFKPANNKAKELYEKLQKARKQVREKNQEDAEGLNVSDTISIVACYADGVNLNTIWDFTIYQLYESYVRLQIWDNFHITQTLAPHLDEDAMKNNKHWGIKVSPNTLKEEK